MKARSLTANPDEFGQSCKFCQGVMCPLHTVETCLKCGWNPKTAEKRKEKIRKERAKMRPEVIKVGF